MKLAIDAINIRSGGALKHLCGILKYATPKEYGFDRVYLFASVATLEKVESKPWLHKIPVSLGGRFGWLRHMGWLYRFQDRIIQYRCDVLFSLSAQSFSKKMPTVAICQTLLPFDHASLMKYFPGIQFFKNKIIRYFQS